MTTPEADHKSGYFLSANELETLQAAFEIALHALQLNTQKTVTDLTSVERAKLAYNFGLLNGRIQIHKRLQQIHAEKK